MSKEPKKSETKALSKMDASWNKERMYMGMRGVDPADIRPPQIIICQKSSDTQSLVDKEGKTPKLGQYFHTGQARIMDSFDCFFLMAQKGTYIDRRKKEQPVLPQYSAIGVMAEDLSIFGIKFRSSALWALSKLFTAVVGLKRPMFSIMVTMGIKELTNDKGTWWIPVIEQWKPIDEGDLLIELEHVAQKFDKPVEKAGTEEEEPPANPPDGSEDVKPDDIPI
jgi:hypothetical protein